MLNKKPSCQSLAIFAALALESSAFLAPSSPVFAADVTMDSEHTHDMSKGARTITTDGTTAWGGRSTDGSTTTDNIVTLDDSVAGTYQNVYGGWTEGNTTGDSTKNQLTIAEKANLMDSGVEIYGGYTDAKDGGRANENTVIIQRDVNGFVKGGFSPNQSADENTVRIGKVRVTGNVSGGEGIRTANKNEVHLTGTTVGNSVYGGYSRGKATDNKVYLYGGVNIARNLYGGYGSGDSTGNKLFVEGKDNKAQKVDRFQQMTFKTDGVAEGETMLQVTGTVKTKVDWDSKPPAQRQASPCSRTITALSYRGAPTSIK